MKVIFICIFIFIIFIVFSEHGSDLIFVNVKLPRARRLGFLALAVEHRVEELPGHLQSCFGIRDA